MKYKCIRKCYHLGRRFYVDEICEFDDVPPHHFKPVSSNEEATIVLNKKDIVDPMKPIMQEEVFAMSQVKQNIPSGGFAVHLNEKQPDIQPKKLGRPRKNK